MIQNQMRFPQFTKAQKEQLLAQLQGLCTPHKLRLYEQVLPQRTRHITLVAENIYAEQNAIALLRTAECLGIQDVHVIEEDNAFKTPKKITSGADKWIDLHRYRKPAHDLSAIVMSLKAQGYQIVATVPKPPTTAHTPFDIPLEHKIALFFGEEESGLTQAVMQHADLYLGIPMYGFTESLNVSVSAGIILSTLVHRLKSSTLPWELSDEEQIDLKLHWITQSIKGGKEMLPRMLAQAPE